MDLYSDLQAFWAQKNPILSGQPTDKARDLAGFAI
jgi:hypothetical protein